MYLRMEKEKNAFGPLRWPCVPAASADRWLSGRVEVLDYGPSKTPGDLHQLCGLLGQ